jgi:hypothetical protein
MCGQVIGQVIPVEWRMHCPHIRQSKTIFLVNSSLGCSQRSARI